jgi:hypothetical protein
MIYGAPGTVFPLGIMAPGAGASFQLSIPLGLLVAKAVPTISYPRVSASWRFAAAAGTTASTGDAYALPLGVSVLLNPGAITRLLGGRLQLNRDSYLKSAPMGFDFDVTADPATTETPRKLRLSFRGILPLTVGTTLLIDLFAWGRGRMCLNVAWTGAVQCWIGRGDDSQTFTSTIIRLPGIEQTIDVEWINNLTGPGGTISFYLEGEKAGGPFTTTVKPRLPADIEMYSNASLGNTTDSVDGLVVRTVTVSFLRKQIDYSYVALSGGTVSRDDLEALVVDARAATTSQPAQTLSYVAADGTVTTLDVTVGAFTVPVGQAYKAVLEDWSSGQGVAHPRELVMTRIAAQNCAFEDATLGARQEPWIECLPQGEVPNIAGINYYCEAIRFGGYVQFQFGYDWDIQQMPFNPFGDPTGKRSYMVPHKWRIHDTQGTLLATIETPDGQPLNGTDKAKIFEGPFDGRGCAMVGPGNRWYPHGTVRSGLIWRSADPGAHLAADVRGAIPIFDLSVPFDSHTDYSVNGFDLRIFCGGTGSDGQANGFGNIRAISWEPTDYETARLSTDVTADPYHASLFSTASLTANAALWLRYTPFNVQGRSPITGPGGTRDDRQVIAEPLARYASAPTSTRAHDGRPWREIALHYLTGYVSDAIHAFEGGRNLPLFKGRSARPIVMRNHYYGPGVLSVPENQAYFAQGGRVGDVVASVSPLRVKTPGSGDTPETPYFGTTQIDKAHGHQFPGWGSLLFRTPEFAFLGHRFWDQNRLYSNDIIASIDLWSTRDGAWAFMHAALAWKTASRNSPRLYSRAEILEFVVRDFETFHSRYYASSPGFLNPPTNILTNGEFNDLNALFAAVPMFGMLSHGGGQLSQADFQIGYWLSALGAAEKLGFNAALRAASAKVGQVLDFLIACHRKRIVGRLTQAPRIQPFGGSYTVSIWNAAQAKAVGGDVAGMPRTYADVQKATGASASWDYYEDGGALQSRDGQAIDQLIAGPAILRYLLGLSGDDILAAQAVANGWRQQKISEEMARGSQAGSTWFRYLQATNNPPTASQI